MIWVIDIPQIKFERRVKFMDIKKKILIFSGFEDTFSSMTMTFTLTLTLTLTTDVDINSDIEIDFDALVGVLH